MCSEMPPTRYNCNFFSFHIVLGQDYTTNELMVTFTSGEAFMGSTECTTFSIIDDDILEGPHDFTIEISSIESFFGTDPLLITGSPSALVVTILDDECEYLL